MATQQDNDGWLDTASTREREILDLRSTGMRHALTLGRFHYNRAHQELREQCHDAWLVLIFVLPGSQHYRIDNHEVKVCGGHGLRILPGQYYSSGGRPEQRGELAWLILKAHPFPRGHALGMDAEGFAAVFSQLMDPAHSNEFTLSNGMSALINAAFEAWQDRTTPLTREVIRNRIAALVLASATAIGGPQQEQNATSANAARIDRVTEWVGQHSAEPITVEAMAERSGLSPAHFFCEFKRRVGTSPKDYLLRLRIDTAAQRLREPPPITVTELAHQLGFSSSQYFATVFRRYLGSSPSAWRSLQNPG